MITITDVSPRDGLQNEPEILSVEAKIGLIECLVAAGVPRIELGSFVNPKQVPQMAGTAAVAAAVLSMAAVGMAQPANTKSARSQPMQGSAMRSS